MSKLTPKKIVFNNDNFLVEFKKNNIIQQGENSAESLEREIEFEKELILKAQQKADEIIELAQNEVNDLKQKAQEEIENQRIEEAKKGYEEGHQDGLIKIQEELEEKIKELEKKSFLMEKLVENNPYDVPEKSSLSDDAAFYFPLGEV